MGLSQGKKMLPEFTSASTQNPRKLFLFSHTKVGKTTLLQGLKRCLIIDTEDGSEFIEGYKINVMKIANSHEFQSKLDEAVKPIAPSVVLKQIADEIRTTNEKIKGYAYDYIAFDTVTGIEKYAHSVATYLYKNTNIGKNYGGDDVVMDLPQGGGYGWLRKAYQKILSNFDGLAGKCVIFLGHVKNSSILKDGKELSAQDVALTGRLKQIMASDVDAIGYLFRNKENLNQVICSFKTNPHDLATGARNAHLANAEFVLSEKGEGKMLYNWDKIFIKEGDKK